MRTLTTAIIFAVVVWVPRVQAQGTVLLNNYDSRNGIYQDRPWPAQAGTFVEILGGPANDALVPLLNTDGSGPIFQIQASGVQALGPGSGSFFNVGQAFVPSLAPGQLGWFRLFAWFGAPTWGAAQDRDVASWFQTVGNPEQPAPLMVPWALDLFIPEPSPGALAALALATTALWRRSRSLRKPSSR